MNIRNFALTYPQLMSQAQEKKWSDEQIIQLRKAYELGQRLFDGLYRGQQVPFICHLVRTASILLEENQPIEIVSAALVHAAYAAGYFKDMHHGGITPEHRSEIEHDLGEATELLVCDYDRFPWYRKKYIQMHLDKLESYSDREKQLVLMRIANELEDYIDYGMAYRGDFSQVKSEGYGSQVIELAHQLGRHELAEDLKQVFESHFSVRLPQIVLTNQRASFQLPALKWLKKSYLEKVKTKGKQILRDLLVSHEQN